MAFTTDAEHRATGLVWLDKDRADKPGTHVLIAGVGQFHRNSGLTALTSPPFTARQIADWFLPEGGFDNQGKPLASLALLLSDLKDDEPSQFHEGPVPRGNFAAMETAFTGLVARAEAHPENLMIVYIASHGLGWGERTGIIFENYKENPNQRRHGMTDTDQLARAMGRVRLNCKLVFFDCCRNEGDRFEANEDMGMPVFDRPGDGTMFKPAQVLRSTLAGAESYGEAGGMTVFGKALMEALEGLASDHNKDWEIGAVRLCEITGELMALRKRDGEPIQIPKSELAGDFLVSVAKSTDKVALFLSVAPSVTAPDWVVRCKLADDRTLIAGPEWVGASHARLDLPSRAEHTLWLTTPDDRRMTMPDGLPIADRTVDLDAPVAFRPIPDPNAPVVQRTKSLGGGATSLSVAGSEQSVGAVTSMQDGGPASRSPAVAIRAGRTTDVQPGRHRLSVTRVDGRVFEMAVTLSEGDAVDLNMPERQSPHEWLMPAMMAGVLQPGTLADARKPGPSPVLATLPVGGALALATGNTRARGGRPKVGFEMNGLDGRFHRFQIHDGEQRRFPQAAPASLPKAHPVWVEAKGKGWHEIAFLPTIGNGGWVAELLVDRDAGQRSRLIPYVSGDAWARLLAFLGRRDFPNMARALTELGADTIRRAVENKDENPIAGTAGVLAAVACGRIRDAGLPEQWLRNLTTWFEGLPDGPVALGRHLQREGRMDEARAAYHLALSRGIPVFSLAVDWLAEGLESLGDDGAADALRWSRMVDSLRTFTVLRLEGS